MTGFTVGFDFGFDAEVSGMITKALQTYLETITNITTVVSTRIYPNHLPSNNTAYPVVTHQLISNDHVYVLGGAAGTTTARVQIDCWALTLAEVETLSAYVRWALQGYSGLMDNIDVAFCQLVNEIDMHESPKNASDQYLYRRVMDFTFKYAESIPN